VRTNIARAIHINIFDILYVKDIRKGKEIYSMNKKQMTLIWNVIIKVT
jgi:hypothetical protein